jgi:hypothetical protein
MAQIPSRARLRVGKLFVAVKSGFSVDWNAGRWIVKRIWLGNARQRVRNLLKRTGNPAHGRYKLRLPLNFS